MFITIEGGEGAGKSTLINSLGEELKSKGYQVVVTRAPGGTELGKQLREIILNPSEHVLVGERAELMLYLADRAQHVEEVISPALQEGKVVICDRYNDSTVAYQGGARGLGLTEVTQMCTFACKGVVPNITFFLDLDPKLGFDRMQRTLDRMELEKIEFHQQVRDTFHKIATKEPERLQIIDASQTAENVFIDVLNRLNPCLK